MHLHPPAGREDHRRNGAPGPAEKRGSRQNRGRRLEAAIQRGGMNNAKRKKDPDHLHPGHPPRRSERKVSRPVGLRPLRVAPGGSTGQGLGDPGHWPGDRPGRPPAAGTPQEVSDSGCAGCRWRPGGKEARHQKCSCCRRNSHMKDNYEREGTTHGGTETVPVQENG